MPRLTFSASRRGRAFSSDARAGRQLGRLRAGPVRDDDELVDLRRERRQQRRELGGVPVRDDDRGDAHRPSASSRPGRSPRPSPPTRTRAPARARPRRAARDLRAPGGSRRRARPPARRPPRRPATSSERLVGHHHDGRPRGHRLDHGQPEALVARGLDEARGAAVERREPLVRDVALEPRPAVAELARDALVLRRARRRRARARPSRAAASAASWFFARLDRPDRERVAPSRGLSPASAGRERGVDAVRGHDDAARAEGRSADEVLPRPLGDGQHAGGRPGGPGHDTAEDDPVAAADQRRIVARRRGRGSSRRPGTGRGRAARTACGRAPRRDRGAPGATPTPSAAPVNARGKATASIALGDELGSARHRSDPEPRRRRRHGERPEKVPRRSSRRPSAGGRGRRRRRRRGSRELPPERLDEVGGATPGEDAARASRPAATSSSRRHPASPMPSAIAAGSCGSTSTAAPPATSSVAPPRLVTTGVPHAIASRMGRPNPS